MDINDENQLVVDILAGETEAFTILVKRYQTPIFNLMLRMTACEADAFDLTQEAFVRAYEKLERFKLSGRFFPWIYTIGLNLARDYLRKRKFTVPQTEDFLKYQGPEIASNQENALVQQLDAKRVERLLQQIPADYREAIILRFHEGLALQEVAEALEISVSGAKMRVHRGLLKLRTLFLNKSPDAHSKTGTAPHRK